MGEGTAAEHFCSVPRATSLNLAVGRRSRTYSLSLAWAWHPVPDHQHQAPLPAPAPDADTHTTHNPQHSCARAASPSTSASPKPIRFVLDLDEGGAVKITKQKKKSQKLSPCIFFLRGAHGVHLSDPRWLQCTAGRPSFLPNLSLQFPLLPTFPSRGRCCCCVVLLPLVFVLVHSKVVALSSWPAFSIHPTWMTSLGQRADSAAAAAAPHSTRPRLSVVLRSKISPSTTRLDSTRFLL